MDSKIGILNLAPPVTTLNPVYAAICGFALATIKDSYSVGWNLDIIPGNKTDQTNDHDGDDKYNACN